MFGWGVLKRSPGIGTVLHWRPPDVHIFGADPSLIRTLRQEPDQYSSKKKKKS